MAEEQQTLELDSGTGYYQPSGWELSSSTSSIRSGLPAQIGSGRATLFFQVHTGQLVGQQVLGVDLALVGSQDMLRYSDPWELELVPADGVKIIRDFVHSQLEASGYAFRLLGQALVEFERAVANYRVMLHVELGSIPVNSRLSILGGVRMTAVYGKRPSLAEAVTPTDSKSLCAASGVPDTWEIVDPAVSLGCAEG